MFSKRIVLMLLILVFASLLSACGQKETPASATSVAVSETSLAATPLEPTATASPTDTLPPPTNTPTITPSPTITPTPTPVPPTATWTPYPIDALPVLRETPVPLYSNVPITVENTQEIIQVARWGEGNIDRIALSDDNKSLAVIMSPGVRMYDFPSMEERWRIETPPAISSLAFSPDGKLLALGFREYYLGPDNIVDGKIELRDTQNGELLNTLSLVDKQSQNPAFRVESVTSLAFSPDGKTLASGSGDDGYIKLWRLSDGKLLNTIKAFDDFQENETSLIIAQVNTLVYAPDGKTLAASSGLGFFTGKGTIKVWDTTSWNVLQTIDYGKAFLSALTFGPSGEVLAGGLAGKGIDIWRVKDGDLLHSLVHSGHISDLAFTPDGSKLASSSFDGTVNIWNAENGDLIRTLDSGNGVVTGVAITADGRQIVSADNAIRIWDVDTGDQTSATDFWGSMVLDLEYSPDGTTLASLGWDGKLRLWNASDGTMSVIEEPAGKDGAFGFAYSPDGTTIAIVFRSPTRTFIIDLWKVDEEASGKTLAEFDSSPNIAFGPDGSLLVAATWDGNVKLIKVQGETTSVKSFSASESGIRALTLNPKGDILATGAEDGKIILWSLDGQQLASMTGHKRSVTCLAFSPDGSLLASGSWDGLVKLWDVASGNMVHTLDDGGRSIESVAFSPDGSILASTGAEDSVALWRVSDGELLRNLQGHHDSVSAISFNPSGTTLASGSHDGTIGIWRVR